MEYPKNGSVVIIDDKYEEVKDLLFVLNKNKVPTFYFNGYLPDLPDDEFNNIRILFLDLDIESNGKPKDVIKNLMIILRKLLSKDNGKYIIIAWSSTITNYFDLLCSEIEEDKKKGDGSFIKAFPTNIIPVKKSDVKDGGIINLIKIKDKIVEIIEKDNFLPYYISWENMVLESSKKVLNNFDKISDENTDISKILALLAKASDLVNEDTNRNDILKYGFTPLSSMLINEMQNNIEDEVRLELIDIQTKENILGKVKELITKGNITNDERAKINTIYHTEQIQNCSNSNGEVYLYSDYLNISCSSSSCSSNIKWAEKLTEKLFDYGNESAGDKNQNTGCIYLKKGIFETEYDIKKPQNTSKDKYISELIIKTIKEKIIPIFLEISPACDVAQGKRRKLRLIFGVMIPIEFEYTKKGNSFTDELMIQYDKKNYKVIFDLLSTTAINTDAFISINPIFKFKKEFVTEVQHKVATHISRPGIFNMKDF